MALKGHGDIPGLGEPTMSSVKGEDTQPAFFLGPLGCAGECGVGTRNVHLAFV